MNPGLSISLSFNGQCEEAFQFYQERLGGKITFLLTWGDSPMAGEAPPEWSRKIVHATLLLGGVTLHGGDLPPGKYEQPKGFSLTLGLDDPEKADRMFQALTENGSVRVPLQQTFWARRFGSVTDRYGITWDINCGEPQ